jgi:hypothetical protein
MLDGRPDQTAADRGAETVAQSSPVPTWLESALGAVRLAVESLRAAAAAVGGELEEPAERVAMPNSRRAEQQLRVALNASLGAERALRRRSDLERADAERRRRGGDRGLEAPRGP